MGLTLGGGSIIDEGFRCVWVCVLSGVRCMGASFGVLEECVGRGE